MANLYGKQKSSNTNDTKTPLNRPDAKKILSEIMHKWSINHYGEYSGLEGNPSEAVELWINHQEKMDKDEFSYLKTLKDGSKIWVTPYIDRIKYTLNKFLAHGTVEKNYILAAARSKIYWRGDGMDMFYKIVDETEDARERKQKQGNTEKNNIKEIINNMSGAFPVD